MAKQGKVKTGPSQDTITNRIMTVLLLCFAVMLALVLIAKAMNNINIGETGRYIAYMLIVSIPALFFAAGLFYLLRSGKNEGASQRVFSPWFTFSMTAAVFAVGLFMRAIQNQDRANTVLFVLLPIAAALYIIYYSFQRECFTLSVAVSADALLLYFFYKMAGNVLLAPHMLWICIVLAVLNIAFAVFVGIVDRKGGALKIGSRELKIMSRNSALWPITAFSFVGAAALVVTGLLGRVAAYYSLLSLAGYALLVGVYYMILLAAEEK